MINAADKIRSTGMDNKIGSPSLKMCLKYANSTAWLRRFVANMDTMTVVLTTTRLYFQNSSI